MDASLFAKYQFGGVILHSDEIRDVTLRTIAELWGNDRDGAIKLLGKLAAAVGGPAAQWDEAVIDFETDSQMPYPELQLDADRAGRLHAELGEALAQLRPPLPVQLPRQQDRRHAA
jgi:hypothetical protein